MTNSDNCSSVQNDINVLVPFKFETVVFWERISQGFERFLGYKSGSCSTWYLVTVTISNDVSDDLLGYTSLLHSCSCVMASIHVNWFSFLSGR